MAAVRRGAAAVAARLRAALFPRIAFPYRVELKQGKKYAWCSCGHSRAQPFCDGTHRTSAPDSVPLRFTAEADGKVWLCGCKRTRTPPGATLRGSERRGEKTHVGSCSIAVREWGLQ
uniref:Iron-binding zinc finger CDGSH type domain-containing protein n=1 Tax=Meleagris gallopavo TaxID=9103 RepID=A0A803YF29_MELGA